LSRESHCSRTKISVSGVDDSSESMSGLISARSGDPLEAAADETRRRVAVVIDGDGDGEDAMTSEFGEQMASSGHTSTRSQREETVRSAQTDRLGDRCALPHGERKA
jgi:hypothetical protein